MKIDNPNISNLVDLKSLTDPRYGKVLVVDSPHAAQLRKLDVAYAVVDPGATSPPHFHERTEEVYAIAKGSATVVVDGVAAPVGPGDLVRLPVRTVHSITAGSKGCEFWVSTSPPYCIDDDNETDAMNVDKPIGTGCADGDTPRIALIVGTHRVGSLTARIARQVAEMYAGLGVMIDLIDLAELPCDLYRPEAFETRYDMETPLARRLIAADALHVVTPEYNGSYPGVLKAALDVVPYRPAFDGKPVALVGVAAGDWGGLRTLDQLAAIFGYRSANVYGRKVLIRNVDEAPMDENGHLTDPEIVERLRAQAEGFTQFVRKLLA